MPGLSWNRWARVVPWALVAVCLLPGCRTAKGYRQADKTGAVMSSLQAEIRTLSAQAGETVSALEQVAFDRDADPRKPFERFSKALDTLGKQREQVRKTAQAMRAEASVFFGNWQRDIDAMQNEEVKQLAQERKVALEQRLLDVSRATVEMKDVYEPWAAQIRDLRALLRNDLTSAGIKAAEPLIARAKSDLAGVQDSLDRLLTEVQDVAYDLTAARAGSGR